MQAKVRIQLEIEIMNMQERLSDRQEIHRLSQRVDRKPLSHVERNARIAI